MENPLPLTFPLQKKIYSTRHVGNYNKEKPMRESFNLMSSIKKRQSALPSSNKQNHFDNYFNNTDKKGSKKSLSMFRRNKNQQRTIYT